MNPHCFIEPAITPSQPAREVQRPSRAPTRFWLVCLIAALVSLCAISLPLPEGRDPGACDTEAC